jgi:hypothetical protein
MKKIIFVSILAFCITQVFGQSNWPSIGAKWHYSYRPCSIWGGCLSSIKEFIYFEAVKDTMVNDTVCTKIIVEYHNDKKEIKYMGDEYIFSTEDHVYNYHHGRFYLLYDFSLQVGDTVVLTPGSNCNLYSQLESSDTDFLNAIHRKHIVTEKDSIEIGNKKYLFIKMGFIFEDDSVIPYLTFRSSIIVKGIGSFGFLTGTLFTGIESGYYGPLRCYSDSSVAYTTEIPCDMLTSSNIELNKNSKVCVYPNPVTSNSLINFPNEMKNDVVIEIIDATGRIITSTETCEDHVVIGSENFTTGVFFYRVYSKDGFIGSGRFVKHR